MSRPLKNKTHPIKSLLALGLAMLFITSCADRALVVMEAPVERLNDLQDHDHDGVIEARERCADTVLNATIDNYGCGTQFSTTEPFKVDIKFANNSFIIPGSAYKKIRDLAAFIDRNHELQVRIEGHTSRVGGAELNQILSENRARAVVSSLINDFGISVQRLYAIGYGFERLANYGYTDEAHAANRRIIVELIKTEYLDDMKWTINTVD
ncbi:MAG: OOP family OmpA-OmpF porin [Paraglaciecola sp.]|jgi:OOP family OmpA-OmpF porin